MQGNFENQIFNLLPFCPAKFHLGISPIVSLGDALQTEPDLEYLKLPRGYGCFFDSFVLLFELEFHCIALAVLKLTL